MNIQSGNLRGALVLATLIFTVISVKYWYKNKEYIIDFDDSLLQQEFERSQNVQIDINTVDINGLINIGLKPKIAKKILRYRDMLGGYVNSAQFEELKLNQQDLEFLNKHLIITNNNIHYLNINSDDFKVLLKHPYLDYETVKKICKYRRYKKINNPNDINGILPEKILPYISYK